MKCSVQIAMHDLSNFDIINAQGLPGTLGSVMFTRSVLLYSHVYNRIRLHTTLRFARVLVSHARPQDFARSMLASTGGGSSCTASALPGSTICLGIIVQTASCWCCLKVLSDSQWCWIALANVCCFWDTRQLSMQSLAIDDLAPSCKRHA